MQTYILRRLAISVPILLGLTVVTFLLTELMPGDFVDGLIPTTAIVNFSPEQLEAMRENYGLNKPAYVRYFIWLRELAQGNLGRSLASGAPVRDEILARLPATLQLTSTALLIGIFLFSLKLPIFPTSGIINYGEEATLLTRIHHMLLPSLVLGLGSMAGFMRYARGSLLDVIRQDYITVARAKGLAERAVLLRHALRNALIPLITIIGLDIPFLIGGTVIIEHIFAWPGMGTYSLAAIFARDYPVIMGVNFVVALVVLLSNLLADITYAFADPRIHYE